MAVNLYLQKIHTSRILWGGKTQLKQNNNPPAQPYQHSLHS
jgi:hypothetical protein